VLNEGTRFTVRDPSSGDVVWDYPPESGEEGLYESPFAVTSERIILAEGTWGARKVVAIDVASRREAWRRELVAGMVRWLALVGGTIYADTSPGWGTKGTPAVTAVDATTGEQLWSHELNEWFQTPVLGPSGIFLVRGRRLVALE
jgi:outer membrane protein assembly factor BamB